MLPSEITVDFKLHRIIQNLFSARPKTLFFFENPIIFWFFFLTLFLAFCKKCQLNFASSYFPPLVSSDGTTAGLPSTLTLCSTFASYSALDDSIRLLSVKLRESRNDILSTNYNCMA